MLLCFGEDLNNFLTVLCQVGGPSIAELCFLGSELPFVYPVYLLPVLW